VLSKFVLCLSLAFCKHVISFGFGLSIIYGVVMIAESGFCKENAGD